LAVQRPQHVRHHPVGRVQGADDIRAALAIFYEHAEQCKPLFAELDRRGGAYNRPLARAHRSNPAVRASPSALVGNRISPSASVRRHTGTIGSALDALASLEAIDATLPIGVQATLRSHGLATSRFCTMR
jgi:hypothetical protein